MSNKVSSFFRLDEQVFFTMGAVCLLSLIILAFRYSADRPCSPVSMRVMADAMIEGQAIRFTVQADAGKNYSWKFGDGEVSEDQTPSTNHIYKKPGKYTVSVVVNGECSDLQNIVIQEKPSNINAPIMPVIVMPPGNVAYINEPVRFNEVSPNASSWEWRFGESTMVDANTKSAEYIFKTAGTKSVSVTVNGKPELTISRYITIINKEEETKINIPKTKTDPRKNERQVVVADEPIVPPIGPKPETPVIDPQLKKDAQKAPTITHAQVESMLMGVVSKTAAAGDFSQYLCGNISKQVVYNGKPMPFDQMCVEIADIKKRRVKKITVVLFTDPATNCISSMAVTLTKTIL